MSVMFTNTNDIKLMKDKLEKSSLKQKNEPRYHTLRNAMNSQVQIAYNNASFMTSLLLTARGLLVATDDNKENVAPECRVYCDDDCCCEILPSNDE
jgi:hypothetical protein